MKITRFLVLCSVSFSIFTSAFATTQDDTKTLAVDDITFQRIKSNQKSTTPYGGNWVQVYGGIVSGGHGTKPAALIGGLISRDRLLLTDRDDTNEKPISVSCDIGFLKENWGVAHEWAVKYPTGGLGSIGRFGWTFGATVGTLGNTQTPGNDTDTNTEYFTGLTYFLNPQMTIAAGGVVKTGEGIGKSHFAVALSLDLASIGHFFGGK